MLSVLTVPLVLLISTEGVLRLAGYGFSARFFQHRVVDGRAVLTDNQDFGRLFFPPGLVRHPHPFTIPSEKPANAIRVFVLGESAAMGDPSPRFGMPRMVEVLLRERFPDRQVEVVNASMVAINSHLVLPIARECARQRGDLWVIFMGNNEVIGPFGSASVFGAQAPPLPVIRVGMRLRATRLGQMLEAALHWARRGKQPARAWAGMEMMADQKVRADSPSTKRVHEYFERNLTDMLKTGSEAGVPIVLCTVATNLKDCAPFASLHRVGLGPGDLSRWQSAYDVGVACQNQGDAGGAKAAYEQAAQIDNEYADLSFRRAQCSLLLGQDAEAAVLFRQARDQDALQFRTDSRLNETIRRSAAAFAQRRVSLLDAEQLFATNSPHGLVGAEYFYEHVHFTPEGNYLLARAVAETAVKTLSLASNRDWVSESECFRLLGLTDGNRYEAFETILDRIKVAPFTNQIDYARQLQRVNEQLARYRLASKPAQVKRDLQLVSKLVAARPEDPDLRWNLAVLLENAGDNPGAEAQWRALIAMQPQAAQPRFNLAKLLDRLGRFAEAYPLFNEGLRINPEYYPARFAQGALCLKLDRVPEAVSHLELTVGQKPEAIEPRLALSQALVRARRTRDAERELREVLRLDQNNAAAQAQLRQLLATPAGH